MIYLCKKAKVEAKKEHPKVKSQLHERNRHNQRYDLDALSSCSPELASFVIINKYNDKSIDFANPQAVMALNRALLKMYYDISEWEIPAGYLCPPIPGRADYIHNIADLLAESNNGTIPKGDKITCLDIGIGANCVYPIIGVKEYAWKFIGSDVDSISLASANNIIKANALLQSVVECRLQANYRDFFRGIIKQDELIDISICNPPFHASMDDAKAGTVRKLTNLSKKEVTKAVLNFGGRQSELCYDGGEERFVMEMIHQSKQYAKSCLWFSSLISKQETLDAIYFALDKAKVVDIKTINMGQGNKISRVVAWTFFSKMEREQWSEKRWQ